MKITRSAIALPLLGLMSCNEKEQPNVLFILADDFGWADTGYTGSEFYETPNLDSLAANGVCFTRSYAACQVSSPTRASVMTGLYTTRHGITNWIGEKSGEEWRTMGRHTRLLPAEYEHNLDYEKFPCLPQVLKEGGYSTFMAGKWHLGRQTTPEMAGFEINKGGFWAGQPLGGYFSPYKNPVLEDGPDGENLSQRLADETNLFIERHVKSQKGKPFFAYLSFYAVHGPIQCSRENWQHFRDKADSLGCVPENSFLVDRTLPVNQSQCNPVYAGLIKHMDDAIGSVLAKLEELGIDDNTIVIFTSDNGGVSSGDCYSTSNLPLRGGKGRQWEGGLRVPLFIYAPEGCDAGSFSDVPVNTIDLYPTILDYAGLDAPSHVDGVSIRKLVEGDEIEDRQLFWHYPHYGNQGGEPSSVVMEGDWKLIYYHEDEHLELYDLSEDIGERNNLADKYPQVRDAMAEKLSAWLKETGARMPVLDPEFSLQKHDEYMETTVKKVMEEQNRLNHVRMRDNWSPNRNWWESE